MLTLAVKVTSCSRSSVSASAPSISSSAP